MTRVDRMSELFNALRQQMTKAEAKRASSTGNDNATSETSQAQRPESLSELNRRIGRELKRYNLKSMHELKLARQNFVESVLSWDLGDQLLHDPKFNLIVRNVEEIIASDERTSEDLNELIASLQNAGAAG